MLVLTRNLSCKKIDHEKKSILVVCHQGEEVEITLLHRGSAMCAVLIPASSSFNVRRGELGECDGDTFNAKCGCRRKKDGRLVLSREWVEKDGNIRNENKLVFFHGGECFSISFLRKKSCKCRVLIDAPRSFSIKRKEIL